MALSQTIVPSRHEIPESKEFLGGFVIIDVPDLDAALAWAARNPSAAHGAIEVHPIGGAYFAAAK